MPEKLPMGYGAAAPYVKGAIVTVTKGKNRRRAARILRKKKKGVIGVAVVAPKV